MCNGEIDGIDIKMSQLSSVKNANSKISYEGRGLELGSRYNS